MGFLSVIRRWALRDKMPIREMARRTGLSRNTVKKYLREGAVEPQFKTPSRPGKLDPYAARLSAWLLAQTRKSRKERRNVKLMYEDLVKLGYDGSYERVAAFARAWRADRHPLPGRRMHSMLPRGGNVENVVLIGGPGTGKSHVATAIGVQAIEHHRRKVRFYSPGSPTAATSSKPATIATASKLAQRPRKNNKGERHIDQSIAVDT
ncbi:MAG: hypothetical protein ACI8R4_001959 [Paracoccaceae bacterium]|jgi:hypothetical protein